MIGAYLLGGFSPGYWLVRWRRGIDVRNDRQRRNWGNKRRPPPGTQRLHCRHGSRRIERRAGGGFRPRLHDFAGLGFCCGISCGCRPYLANLAWIPGWKRHRTFRRRLAGARSAVADAEPGPGSDSAGVATPVHLAGLCSLTVFPAAVWWATGARFPVAVACATISLLLWAHRANIRNFVADHFQGPAAPPAGAPTNSQ